MSKPESSVVRAVTAELDRLWGKNGVPAIILPPGRARTLQAISDALVQACDALVESDPDSEVVLGILHRLRLVDGPNDLGWNGTPPRE